MTVEEIFLCDKTSWYKEMEDGTRVWNQELLNNFWSLIRVHKILRGDYLFENIIFPSCTKGSTDLLSPSSNFFVDVFANTSRTIVFAVIFKNCRFQDKAQFLGHIPGIDYSPEADISFLKGLRFEDCFFEREFRCQGLKISNALHIINCHFFGKSVLMYLTLLGSVEIYSSKFKSDFSYHTNKHFGSATISDNKFEENFLQTKNIFLSSYTITKAEFNGEMTLFANIYETHGSLVSIKFNNRSRFSDEKYNNFHYQDIDFSSKRHLIENIEFNKFGALSLRNLIFPTNVTMRNVDFTKIKLFNSEISEIRFTACSWGDNERIILLNERDLKKGDKDEIKQLEYLYRELKRNFENSKDWELTGRSYVSELKFRQQRLLIEKKYFSWFVYWFYDFFGGYTESYIRPTFWFISLTFLIFPQYYRVFENNSSSYSEFFIKSIAASAPWLHTELKYESWSILAFQKTISTILLTFIILALRKRFR